VAAPSSQASRARAVVYAASTAAGCIVQAFKDGDVRFLICIDVAARDIDIRGLPYIINMTLPDKSEDYIHRCNSIGEGVQLQAVVTCGLMYMWVQHVLSMTDER
jgi:hypothetical protein